MTEGNEELDAAKVTQCDVELCWSSKDYGVSLRTQDLQVWIYQPLPSDECRKIFLVAHLARHRQCGRWCAEGGCKLTTKGLSKEVNKEITGFLIRDPSH